MKIFLATLMVLTVNAGEEIPSGEFKWRSDLEEARKDAVRLGKPLLIVFR